MFGRPKRRALPAVSSTIDPMTAWHQWVADGMQQHERGLSPHEESAPSALILVPLLGLPALVIVGMILVFVLS